MTWSFNESLATDRDLVRLELGDTDTTDQLVTDELIAALLLTEKTVLATAAKLAEHLQAKFSRKVTSAEGPIRAQLSDMSEKYRKLANDLRRRSGNAGLAAPVVSGTSKAKMAEVRANTDRAVSKIRAGMHDNPEACW